LARLFLLFQQLSQVLYDIRPRAPEIMQLVRVVLEVTHLTLYAVRNGLYSSGQRESPAVEALDEMIETVL